MISPKSCYLRCDANDTVTDFELGVWTENEERQLCYCGRDCPDDDDECCGDYGESAHSRAQQGAALGHFQGFVNS